MFEIRFKFIQRTSPFLCLHYHNIILYKMETSGTNNIPENVEGNIQTAKKKIKPKRRSTEKILQDMGFVKTQVV